MIYKSVQDRAHCRIGFDCWIALMLMLSVSPPAGWTATNLAIMFHPLATSVLILRRHRRSTQILSTYECVGNRLLLRNCALSIEDRGNGSGHNIMSHGCNGDKTGHDGTYLR